MIQLDRHGAGPPANIWLVVVAAIHRHFTSFISGVWPVEEETKNYATKRGKPCTGTFLSPLLISLTSCRLTARFASEIGQQWGPDNGPKLVSRDALGKQLLFLSSFYQLLPWTHTWPAYLTPYFSFLTTTALISQHFGHIAWTITRSGVNIIHRFGGIQKNKTKKFYNKLIFYCVRNFFSFLLF